MLRPQKRPLNPRPLIAISLPLGIVKGYNGRNAEAITDNQNLLIHLQKQQDHENVQLKNSH